MRRSIGLFATACIAVTLAASPATAADPTELEAAVRKGAAEVEKQVIAWRHDIHEHPELGDREERTAKLVADHLRSLGMEVKTGVARTGVVGILRGQKKGRTVALRADMDALPGREETGLPFASRVSVDLEGEMTPLMHACGHDAHTAMLMGAASVLAELRDRLPGTVLFLFQPAEEGSSVVAPGEGKSWGAKLMLEEGVFKQTKPDAVFALHVMPGPSGQILWREGPVTASGDNLYIVVQGRQGHGGMPWNAIDPIVTSALVISGLQTVVSRSANLTESPVVITVGTIKGGTRGNIVADRVDMTGTIRTYDPAVRKQVHANVERVVKEISASTGARGQSRIVHIYDATVNDPALTRRMLPAVTRAADGKIAEAPLAGASEDFSFFAKQAPGLYLYLGATPPGIDPAKAAPNHNPKFLVDDGALVVGTRTLATLAVDFLAGPPPPQPGRRGTPFIEQEETRRTYEIPPAK